MYTYGIIMIFVSIGVLAEADGLSDCDEGLPQWLIWRSSADFVGITLSALSLLWLRGEDAVASVVAVFKHALYLIRLCFAFIGLHYVSQSGMCATDGYLTKIGAKFCVCVAPNPS